MSDFNKKAMASVIKDVFTDIIVCSPLNRPYSKIAVAPLDLSAMKITEYKMKYNPPTPDTIERIVARCVIAPDLVMRVIWEQVFGYVSHQKTALPKFTTTIELDAISIKLSTFSAVKRDFSVRTLKRYDAIDCSIDEFVSCATAKDMYIGLDNSVARAERLSAEIKQLISPYV